ncbi:MAG: tRNA pseudouridine(55) synthase TruB [Lachnospiraceae bacterium]|nr:tRNA pseudouridine(55) synthase TruB [Lachnospiraceae bacterium]MBQ9234631.1 tRNA pseudouridine(55) synthase TruB [Lachnospiraceae bacterium]
MIDGIINVYKEKGFTSFDVVAKLRGILKQKKIGHTGTLDPMAEGVLIVCLGKATKLVDILITSSKQYKAAMQLGLKTDTEDVTGETIHESDSWKTLSEDEITDAVNSFIGTYSQLPPMYSAIKKDGKKLYEYARAGIEVERQKRDVEIISIDNINIKLPYVYFDVKCSKGTYIRSLCRDIGDKLGCGACLFGLTRNELHGMLASDAYKLSDIESLRDKGELDKCIIPMDVLLKDYDRLDVKPQAAKLLSNGNKLKPQSFNRDNSLLSDKEADKLYRIYDNDKLMALYRYDEADDIFVPFKMFL